MSDNFNTYIDRIDFEAWCELCVSMGTLRSFAKNEGMGIDPQFRDVIMHSTEEVYDRYVDLYVKIARHIHCRLKFQRTHTAFSQETERFY